MNHALVLIDIQNDYFPGGKMELMGSVAAARQAACLLAYAREVEMPVVFVQHIAVRPGATFFLPGTPGTQIHAAIQPLPGETIIQKHFPNSFRETRLEEHLRSLGATHLVIAGMMTHMCVDATVRAAVDLGFECLIAADGCATKDLTFEGETVPAGFVHRSFLAALHGTYGRVMRVEAVLRQLETL